MTTLRMVTGLLAALTLLFIGAGEAHAGFGAGLSFSDTTGVTGEYAFRGRDKGRGSGQVIEATVGLESSGYAHVAWKWYIKPLARTKWFSLPIYAGVGPYLAGGDGFLGSDEGGGKKGKGKKKKKKGDDGDREIGARVPVGIAMDFSRFPAHLFLEISAMADTDDLSAIDTTTYLGFRWFF